MFDTAIDIAELIISMMIFRAPKDTYNMVNTIGYIVYDDDHVDILIGGEFAPYAPIVNEGRKDRPLSAREQQNVGWFDRVLEQAGILLASLNQGVAVSYV